jgi:hypothetical protein
MRIFMIRTEAVTEIPLHFCSFHRRFDHVTFTELVALVAKATSTSAELVDARTINLELLNNCTGDSTTCGIPFAQFHRRWKQSPEYRQVTHPLN